MIKLFILFMVVLSMPIYGQNYPFMPIEMMDSKELLASNRSKLLYFHGDNCPPCKYMEKTIFKDEALVNFLDEQFECYSIYGYEGTNQVVRNLFNVRYNPTFVALDSIGNILHEFVGAMDANQMISEFSLKSNNETLKKVSDLFKLSPNELSNRRRFLHALEKAGRLEVVHINTFLNSIPPQVLWEDSQCLHDVLHFASNNGQLTMTVNHPLYPTLVDISESTSHSHTQKYLQDFLYAVEYNSMIDTTKTIPDENHTLERLMSYERGQRIYLRSIKDTSNVLLVFQSNVPSFSLNYHRLANMNDKDQVNSLLLRYFDKHRSHPEVLNDLAWRVYVGDINGSHSIAIDMVRAALAGKENYNILDTYAHLLFATNNFIEAKNVASEAILLAESEGINAKGTKRLIALLDKKI